MEQKNDDEYAGAVIRVQCHHACQPPYGGTAARRRTDAPLYRRGMLP